MKFEPTIIRQTFYDMTEIEQLEFLHKLISRYKEFRKDNSIPVSRRLLQYEFGVSTSVIKMPEVNKHILAVDNL